MFRVKAQITDVFSSIQGEGIFLGAKQIFVRLRDCNLSCRFCDEKKDGDYRDMTALELLTEVKFLDASKGPHHSVSITGGEPLLYTDFLKTFLKLLKRERFKIYLETNGTLPEELSEVIDLIDIIAMDFKLPSSTGEKDFWKQHLKFLKVALKAKVFVKAVVTKETTKKDIEKAVRLLKKIRANIPLILQPATPVSPESAVIDNSVLFDLMEVGLKKKFENIKIVPQLHKVLGVK